MLGTVETELSQVLTSGKILFRNYNRTEGGFAKAKYFQFLDTYNTK